MEFSAAYLRSRTSVLEFSDIVNRNDFIDTIVQFADRSRFEVGLCVRSEANSIAKPMVDESTKYAVLSGNSRRDALRTAWKLSRLLKEWNIDILHAHHFEQAVVGWLATRFYRTTRLVIGRHYSDAIYRNPSRLKRNALLAIEQRINRDCERIIVPSQMIFEILTERQGISPEKIDVIQYGFVPEKYVLPTEQEISSIRREFGMEGRFTVANFSRYHEEKGHRFLIEAASRLKDRFPDILILCVGEGPERDALERTIESNALSDTVILTGWRKDAMAIMAASDVVAQSTLQEAFSQVMCEAMWIGKPLVMTDVSGASDIITDEVNGLLIPTADPEALASAIGRLILSGDLRQRLVRNAALVIRNLEITSQIAEYEQAFERAMH